MSNSKLVVPTESITLPGATEPLVLRGLSVNDLKTLINLHRDVATTLFAKIIGINGEGDDVTNALLDIDGIVTMVIDEFPLVLADFIALGANDLDNAEDYLAIPAMAQFEAIGAICRLTFGEDEALKKLVATVTKLMAGINKTVAPQKS